MKVLVISAAFPPMKAGEADHTYRICLELAKRGLHVELLTTHGSRVDPSFPFTVHPWMNDWSWHAMPRFANFVSRCAPDVVLFIYIGWIYQDHPMMTFAPTVIRRIRSQCRIVTQFEYPMGCNNDKFSLLSRVVRRLAERWAGHDVDYVFGTLLRDSDAVIVLSDRHKQMLADLSPSIHGKLTLIPPPPLLTIAKNITPELRRQVRFSLGYTPADVVFVYFGYIYPPKGVETLLRAFHIICEGRENVRLLLIGGVVAHEYPDRPDFAQEMRELPKELGFDRQVKWIGAFETDSDLASRYLYASDICVFPHDLGVYLNNSSFAGAVAHGLPTVATRASHVEPTFIDGENLLFCTPKSPESMAAAMRLILDDGQLRKRLARGAAKLASEWFSWETATNHMLHVLGAGEVASRRAA
ncbi:hypothetical protein W02_12620 [Nitrospira sp. KM1]|uniref:glycosyltransferase family 4 protein n=1 Tax=Nitrospira sp. KM1 TaxID=1936990 RepID=UPI0013A7A8B7|nr:glycosyltransferase family 4 protein [Nitrospira sp. KM1]BCA54122.1 hypothetical protein W02_12620 [Nitrospira sp. KM1]